MIMVDANKAPENAEEAKTAKNKVKTKSTAPKKIATDKQSKPVKKSVKDDAGKDVAKKPVLRKDTPTVAATKKTNVVEQIKKFLRSSYVELKKVNWLGRKEIVSFTGVVLVSVAIVGAAIFVVDTLLSKILTVIIK